VEVSGQLHSPFTLSLGKCPKCSLDRRLGESQSQSGCGGGGGGGGEKNISS
jgi:hypothetical protein